LWKLKISDLKIVIIGPAWPLRGGIANFNEALCKSLLDEGHDTQIVSFTLQYPSFLFPGKSQFENKDAAINLPVTPMINSVNPASWYKTAKYIRSLKPDLVIIRYWMPFMAPALGTIAKNCRNKNTVVIGLTDNIIPHEKRVLDKQLTSYFVNRCDGFVVMSDQVKNDLQSFNKNKPVIKRFHPIYNIFGDSICKKDARNKLEINENDQVILFFGFIRKYKRLDLLLHAMSDERIKKQGIKLIVAGEFYEDRKYYDDIVASKNISDSVMMTGSYISKEAVKYYFCASDLVVQPYRSATQSGVTQIAYYYGVPMVVTNVGGLPEIVEDGVAGFVCDTDSDAVSDCIVKYFNDTSWHQKLREGVVLNAQQFSWQKMTEGIIELYRNLKN
jgi:glycosyltransferase involved in cell wall biosynthesis